MVQCSMNLFIFNQEALNLLLCLAILCFMSFAHWMFPCHICFFLFIWYKCVISVGVSFIQEIEKREKEINQFFSTAIKRQRQKQQRKISHCKIFEQQQLQQHHHHDHNKWSKCLPMPKEGDKFQSKDCIHNYVCDLNQIHMQECVPNKWEQQEEEDKVCL